MCKNLPNRLQKNGKGKALTTKGSRKVQAREGEVVGNRLLPGEKGKKETRGGYAAAGDKLREPP